MALHWLCFVSTGKRLDGFAILAVYWDNHLNGHWKGRLDPFRKECESIDCAIIGPVTHLDVAATDEGSVVGA